MVVDFSKDMQFHLSALSSHIQGFILAGHTALHFSG